MHIWSLLKRVTLKLRKRTKLHTTSIDKFVTRPWKLD
jgi:hypothetical protein